MSQAHATQRLNRLSLVRLSPPTFYHKRQEQGSWWFQSLRRNFLSGTLEGVRELLYPALLPAALWPSFCLQAVRLPPLCLPVMLSLEPFQQPHRGHSILGLASGLKIWRHAFQLPAPAPNAVPVLCCYGTNHSSV